MCWEDLRVEIDCVWGEQGLGLFFVEEEKMRGLYKFFR